MAPGEPDQRTSFPSLTDNVNPCTRLRPFATGLNEYNKPISSYLSVMVAYKYIDYSAANWPVSR